MTPLATVLREDQEEDLCPTMNLKVLKGSERHQNAMCDIIQMDIQTLCSENISLSSLSLVNCMHTNVMWMSDHGRHRRQVEAADV